MDNHQLVMNSEQRRIYTFDRKLYPDPGKREEQLIALKKITIHNAFRTAEVENLLKQAGVKVEKYFPEKSAEAHFYDWTTGHLHVVNPRGEMRLVRDHDQSIILEEIAGRPIVRSVNNYSGSRVSASKRFTDFAFELVDEIFQTLKEDDLQKKGLINLLIGPHNSLDTSNCSVETVKEHDFLNYRILTINNQLVVNLDYIFADQARNVLSQFYLICNSFENLDVNVFHYGKIGLLNPNLDIGAICLPTGSLDENSLINDYISVLLINNQLAGSSDASEMFRELAGEEVHTGITVNTTSVLNQRRDTLEKDLAANGDFLDMEWSVMAGLDHGYKNSYPNLGRINYFFAGVGSDKPLEGKTLADTSYSADSEETIANAMKEIIKEII